MVRVTLHRRAKLLEVDRAVQVGVGRPEDLDGEKFKELRAEIAKLEKRYSMSTEKMLKRLCSGDLLETRTISSWKDKYMLLRAHQENVRATA